MEILDDAFYEDLKLKIEQAAPKNSSSDFDTGASVSTGTSSTKDRWIWPASFTIICSAYRIKLDTEGIDAMSARELAALAYATSQVDDASLAEKDAKAAYEKDAYLPLAYLAMAHLMTIQHSAKPARRWLSLAELCSNEIKEVFEAHREKMEWHLQRDERTISRLLPYFTDDSKRKRLERLYPGVTDAEFQGLFQALKERPSEASDLCQKSEAFKAFVGIFALDPLSELFQSDLKETEKADLGRIKSVNTALSIRFGGEAFKPLFFRLAGYPLGPEEEYFHGPIAPNEWEDLTRMISYVMNSTGYLLTSREEQKAFDPHGVNVQSLAHIDHLAKLAVTFRAAHFCSRDLPIVSSLFWAIDLISVFKTPSDAVRAIFRQESNNKTLGVVIMLVSGLLLDRPGLHVAVTEFVRVVSLAWPNFATNIEALGVLNQLRGFEANWGVFASVLIDTQICDLSFQPTPIAPSIVTMHALRPVRSSTAPISTKSPAGGLLRQKPDASGVYNLYFIYNEPSAHHYVDCGMIEVSVGEDQRLTGKGADTLRGAFTATEQGYGHATRQRRGGGINSFAASLKYEATGEEIVMQAVPFTYGFTGSLAYVPPKDFPLAGDDFNAHFGTFLMLYHGKASEDEVLKKRLFKSIPSHLSWSNKVSSDRALDLKLRDRAGDNRKKKLFVPWDAPQSEDIAIVLELMYTMRFAVKHFHLLLSPFCPEKVFLSILQLKQGEPSNTMALPIVQSLLGSHKPEVESIEHYRVRSQLMSVQVGHVMASRASFTSNFLARYDRNKPLLLTSPALDRAKTNLKHWQKLAERGANADITMLTNFWRLSPNDVLVSQEHQIMFFQSMIMQVETQQAAEAPQEDAGRFGPSSSQEVVSDMFKHSKSKKKKENKEEEALPGWLLPTVAVALLTATIGSAFLVGRLLTQKRD